MVMQPVTSWGRLSSSGHEVRPLSDRITAPQVLRETTAPGLPFGNGRSYGDVCLNADGVLWAARGLDRFIAFDAESGRVECEAGVTLQELIGLVLPRGWFVPVTPGTRHVTVGGAIANDVHGKNHERRGTFGEHVESLTLQRTDGTRIVCGPGEQEPWFRATVGGMGLTGLIVSARLRLQPVAGPWIDASARRFASLEEFFALSAELGSRHEYTVSWIDCTPRADRATRGVFFSGDHAASSEPAPGDKAPASVPLVPPVSLVGKASVRAFNALYYRRHGGRPGPFRQHYVPFFYPLDGVLGWNRIYGPRGFYQYQCVVPRAVERDATRALLAEISRSGSGSFLAVLKTFADRVPAGLLSFPMAGTTLALDFPNQGDETLALFERLDAVVFESGGRLYPAKDARMPAARFRQGYPRWREFEAFRDPGISSQMSRRLFGT